ncbi:unnamed protein product [Brachionus calyciflorus]|uniref:Bromo domain-containing protein n=1 Tax=Brachionus calyciflorus TaxID=104777 RepID=A0A813UDD3_9BILA|nr:unnamed protein product [Brachionus calyciflorus]
MGANRSRCCGVQAIPAIPVMPALPVAPALPIAPAFPACGGYGGYGSLGYGGYGYGVNQRPITEELRKSQLKFIENCLRMAPNEPENAYAVYQSKMEDLRRCWKVPYIVYYCNLFEQKLDLIDLRVDEFEEALIDDCGNERNITLVHLLQKLLKPFINRSIDLTNFDQYLLQVLKRYGLDFIVKNARVQDSKEVETDETKKTDVLNDSKTSLNSWNNLTILTKVDIIYKLCELRLSLNDVEAKLSDYEASELRLEPLAVDSNGSKLWYFGDLRLYEEKKPEKKEKPPKIKVQKNAKNKSKNSKKTPSSKQKNGNSSRTTRSSMRLKAKEESEESAEEETGEESEESEVDENNYYYYYEDEELDIEKDIDYEEELKKELKYWSCICLTLDDWISVNENFKNSKKKIDQDISELIEGQYLTEMPNLFQKAEKERQQRLVAIQPKRQSQRLQSKKEISFSENDSDFGSNDEFSKLPPEEQDKMRKEQIARQREERLKQRLLKRETILNDSQNEDLSQEASSIRSLDAADFNIRNYFLMYKVLQKLLQCKYAWPFKNAVSEDDAPDYNTIIETPMDLSTVQLKINNKVYKSRKEFVADLELIVKNCMTYNGDDTYYGKLAQKFQNYFKRWLQIFYPREISTSLEEKNRQLMKLIQRSENPNDTLNDSCLDEANNESQNGDLTMDNTNQDENSNSLLQTNENSQTTLENENRQPIDFSDENFFLNRPMRKKRKPNPDKDKYIQEPEYVTKRTSSGRLVKMKISTDFDYNSDQEKEKHAGPGRPRKRELSEPDDGTQEGIQRRHCKSPNQMINYNSSSDSNQDEEEDDEEFTGKHKPKKETQKKTRKYIRKKDEFGNLVPRRPKKTIAQLTGPNTPNNLSKIYEHSDEDSSCIETKRIFTNTNILRQQSSNLNLPQNSEYSFEQYVKKINSTCTVSQALTIADAVKAACTSPEKTTQITPRLSLKITPAPSSNQQSTPKLPLTIPIVNPAVKAALNRINQQQLIVNNNNNNNNNSMNNNLENNNNKVKIISINNNNLNNNSNGLASKKLLIINNGGNNGQIKPVIVNNGRKIKLENVENKIVNNNASDIGEIKNVDEMVKLEENTSVQLTTVISQN